MFDIIDCFHFYLLGFATSLLPALIIGRCWGQDIASKYWQEFYAE